MMRRLLAGAALVLMTAHAYAGEKVIFQLGWLPGGDKAAVYIGVHKGLFAKEGLDVQILPGRGSADTITKVATGTADLGEGGLATLMIAKAQGDVPVVAVMPIFTKQPDVLLVQKGGPVASLKDVAGKTVATSPYSSSNVVWPLILRANNIDPASVTVLKADPAAMGGMLATGQVAGVINWVTAAAGTKQAMREQSKQMAELSWSDYGFDGCSQCIVASPKLLKAKPETVRKFLKVYMEAEKIMRDDPAASAEALHALAPETDPETVAADAEAALPLIFNEVTKKDGLGTFDPKLVATTWEWAAKAQNVATTAIDPMTAIDNTLAK